MKIEFSANIRDMDPIETEYQGYWFRSRLEARWAVFFEEMGLDWSYEVQGFNLSGDRGEKSTCYLPDFYIQNVKTPWEESIAIWLEVKGVMKKKDKETCKALAIESQHPVLLVQGDPADEHITLYRKHTPVQEVKFTACRKGIRVVKSRTSQPSKALVKAQKAARSERF